MPEPDPSPIQGPHEPPKVAPKPKAFPKPKRKPKLPKKSKAPAIFSVVLVAGLLAFGILPRLRQSDKLASTRHELADTPESVDVVRPVEAPASEDLTLPGNVQAFEVATIFARTSGYLHELYVDIGAHVKQGQVLATIESPEVDEQLSESRENVSKEQAAAQQANADVYRLQAGLQTSLAQVSESRSGLEGALAEVAHAKAKLTEVQGAESAAKAKLTQVQKRLDGQRASLSQYKVKEQLAEKTFKRWKELAAGGAVSGQDLDETEAAYETSQSAVTEAEASVESAKADVVSAEGEVQARRGDVTAAIADIGSANQKVASARWAVTASQSNVGAAKASIQAGKANQSAAGASIRESQSSLDRVAVLRSFEKVTAPFAGVITARNVDVGSLIGAGSGSAGGAADPQSTVTRVGMFGLAKTDALRVQVQVPQNEAGEIHLGDPATITTQSSSTSAEGIVLDTSGALDASSRTLLVEVKLPNPEGRFVPGMYAEVHFKIKRKRSRLRVASDALIIDSNGVRVAKVTPESTVHYEQVQLGRDLGKEVEITSGVDSRDRLIENPSDDLAEGQKVSVAAKKQ